MPQSLLCSLTRGIPWVSSLTKNKSFRCSFLHTHTSFLLLDRHNTRWLQLSLPPLYNGVSWSSIVPIAVIFSNFQVADGWFFCKTSWVTFLRTKSSPRTVLNCSVMTLFGSQYFRVKWNSSNYHALISASWPWCPSKAHHQPLASSFLQTRCPQSSQPRFSSCIPTCHCVF